MTAAVPATPAPTPSPQLTVPDVAINVRDVFGFDTDMKLMGFAQADEHVPDLDPDYIFDRDTTLAILASFVHNRRVMIQGYHGTGKSTHIEHVISPLHRTDLCPRPLRRLRTRLPGRLLVQRQGCLPLMQHPAHG